MRRAYNRAWHTVSAGEFIIIVVFLLLKDTLKYSLLQTLRPILTDASLALAHAVLLAFQGSGCPYLPPQDCCLGFFPHIAHPGAGPHLPQIPNE